MGVQTQGCYGRVLPRPLSTSRNKRFSVFCACASLVAPSSQPLLLLFHSGRSGSSSSSSVLHRRREALQPLPPPPRLFRFPLGRLGFPLRFFRFLFLLRRLCCFHLSRIFSFFASFGLAFRKISAAAAGVVGVVVLPLLRRRFVSRFVGSVVVDHTSPLLLLQRYSPTVDGDEIRLLLVLRVRVRVETIKLDPFALLHTVIEHPPRHTRTTVRRRPLPK